MRFSNLLAALVLLALANSVVSTPSRSLLQACPIWKCASGCQLEDQLVNGVRRWTCAACAPTYRLLTNKRACVCPAGTSETPTGTCARCPQGFWCPAGNGNGPSSAQTVGGSIPLPVNNENVTSGMRSFQISCGRNMTTRLMGAKEEISCVVQAGFSYAGAGQNATLCPINTYNPGLNRLPTCYSCPSGLITTTPGSNLKLDCLVPAGFIMNRGVVSPCPKGTFREGTALPTAQLNCTRCARGWTTVTVASTTFMDCARTLPGFYSLTGNQGSFLGTEAFPCPVGWWAGERPANDNAGQCIQCTNGWTTRNLTVDTDGKPIGATSSSACGNPPGTFTNIVNAIENCPNGTYAAGWARRTSCTSCGINIFSAELSVDERDASARVRAQPTDCYMPAGYGMTFNRATAEFTAAICPINTYGSAELTYGLKFSPCKPCARGLITPGPGMTSDDNCTNPAGWGWNGFTAEICAAGSYAAANTLLPCANCPMNRNTTSILPSVGTPFTDALSSMPLPGGNGSDMDEVTDCKVVAGFGVMNTTNIDAFTATQKAALDVGECPIGTFSPGGLIDSLCTRCATTTGNGAGGLGPYSSTLEAGSTSVTACNVCLPGYGTAGGSHSTNPNLCTGCLDGLYQPGGTTACISCGGPATFIYPGKQDPVESPATTRIGTGTTPGARSIEECYPAMFQMDESMGTHLADTSNFIAGSATIVDGTASLAASSAQQCANMCNGDNANCVGATFIYADTLISGSGNLGGRCLMYLRNPPGSIYTLYVKVLPLDFLSGASTGKAAVASGHYVKWSAANLQHGTTISNTTDTVESCKSLCNNNSQCWGFYYNGFCILRKGYEAEGHRTFLHAVGELIE